LTSFFIYVIILEIIFILWTVKKKFFYPWTQELSEESLLAFYDNPNNFTLKDPRKKNISDPFPENTFVLLTHGSFAINGDIRNNILFHKQELGSTLGGEVHKSKKAINYHLLRVLKNFSDFWTSVMVKHSWIPKGHIIKHTGSRFIWDPNRDINADDFIRKTDFYGNIILENPERYRPEWETEHKKYHDKITEKLSWVEKEEWGVIAFDIHDTWVREMSYNTEDDRFKKEAFPLMTLGTRDGLACNPEILEYFSERIEHYLWIKPLLNDPYKWGYVTQRHGEKYRKDLEQKWENPWKRNMIQVEIWKFLYMQESTQKVDKDRMSLIWIWIHKAIADTWKKFDKEYFASL